MMASPYDLVRVEKLRVKGDALPLKGGTTKKRKKPNPDKIAPLVPEDSSPAKLPRYDEALTPTERRFRERAAQFEQMAIKKMAMKSHRERIESFNAQLEKEPSHFDIPKVGPG